MDGPCSFRTCSACTMFAAAFVNSTMVRAPRDCRARSRNATRFTCSTPMISSGLQGTLALQYCRDAAVCWRSRLLGPSTHSQLSTLRRRGCVCRRGAVRLQNQGQQTERNRRWMRCGGPVGGMPSHGVAHVDEAWLQDGPGCAPPLLGTTLVPQAQVNNTGIVHAIAASAVGVLLRG